MTVLYAKMAKRQSTLKRDDQKKSKVEQEATDEMEVKQEESEDEEAEVDEAEGGEESGAFDFNNLNNRRDRCASLRLIDNVTQSHSVPYRGS